MENEVLYEIDYNKFLFSKTLTYTYEHKIKSFTIEQKQFKKLILYKWSIVKLVTSNINEIIKYTHELTNTHLAAKNQYYCQQCKRILSLADKRFHLQSNEHKNSKRMWYCEVCKKHININTRSSHIKSAAHIENEVISRKNNNLTDKTYTYINPDFEKVDNLVIRAIDDSTKYLHRFKYKCELL